MEIHKKFEQFVDVKIDSITKKYNNDEYENLQDAIEDFYDEMDEFVRVNYHRAEAMYVEYDPDYDQAEQTGHDILSVVKGHSLIDFMVADLLGVVIHIMIITKD